MQITVLNSINFVFSEIKHFFKQNQIANEIQLKHNGTPIENIISLVPAIPILMFPYLLLYLCASLFCR